MDVNAYLQRSRAGDGLLFSTVDADLPVQVHEYEQERWVYTGENSILSLMRLDAPADPVLPNHVAMLAALLFSELPATVLNLGLGAGAFERFFEDRLPDTTVVSVDTSEVMIDIARRFFTLRPECTIVNQTAEQYLATHDRRHDLILCDIFCGDRHPDCLTDEAFYRNAARALATGGVMAFNLSPATEQVLLDILITLRRSFAHVMLVNLVDYGNIVVYAMQHPPLIPDRLLQRAAVLGRQLRLDLGAIPERLTALPPVPDTREAPA